LEFGKDGRELKVHVEGQLVFNGTFPMLNAALAGFGLGYVPEDVAQPHLAKGRLKRVLEDCARRIRAITSITRAAANQHQNSPCSSMRCATAGLGQLRTGDLTRTQRANGRRVPDLLKPGQADWVLT
jgi:DNA-binding transcriptional LysR family regulator